MNDSIQQIFLNIIDILDHHIGIKLGSFSYSDRPRNNFLNISILVLGIDYHAGFVPWECVLVEIRAFPGLFSTNALVCVINIINGRFKSFALLMIKSPNHGRCPKRKPIYVFDSIGRLKLHSGFPKNTCCRLINKNWIRISLVYFWSICNANDHVFVWNHLPDVGNRKLSSDGSSSNRIHKVMMGVFSFKLIVL